MAGPNVPIIHSSIVEALGSFVIPPPPPPPLSLQTGPTVQGL